MKEASRKVISSLAAIVCEPKVSPISTMVVNSYIAKMQLSLIFLLHKKKPLQWTPLFVVQFSLIYLLMDFYVET